MRNATRDYLARLPERLVVSGYRNVMAAYELSDMSCWEALWRLYIGELGAPASRRLMGELQYWARGIRCRAERPVSFYPHCCLHLCHDECMAVALVAASQAEDEAAGLMAARHLTASADPHILHEAWQSTLPFAQALKECGQHMYPVPADVVDSIAAMQRTLCKPCKGRLN